MAFVTRLTRAWRDSTDMALLEVENISVSLPTASGYAEAVRKGLVGGDVKKAG